MIVSDLPTAVDLVTEWVALKKKVADLESVNTVEGLAAIIRNLVGSADYDRIKELEAQMAAIDVTVTAEIPAEIPAEVPAL